jgi:hypothetical protein
MTDEIDHAADSGKDVQMKDAATVHDYPRTQNDTYLVEYADGDVEYEPNTLLNRTIFGAGEDEDSKWDELNGQNTFELDGDEIDVTLSLRNQTAYMTMAGTTVNVSDEFAAVASSTLDALRGDQPEELAEIFLDTVDEQVRRGVVTEYLDRFPEDRIEITDDGWVVDDTFVVTYEAENYLTTDKPIYHRQGGDMVEMDSSAEAVDLDLQFDGSKRMPTTSGSEHLLSTDEQRFLVTVETLLFPSDYLDAELVDDVEQYKAEQFHDPIEGMAAEANNSGFTATDTREHHDHSITKHRLSDSFDVTSETLSKMATKEYSHLAVHELALREDEFRNADFDVFEDVGNNPHGRWDDINDVTDSAPISADSMAELKEKLSDEGIELQLEY